MGKKIGLDFKINIPEDDNFGEGKKKFRKASKLPKIIRLDLFLTRFSELHSFFQLINKKKKFFFLRKKKKLKRIFLGQEKRYALKKKMKRRIGIWLSKFQNFFFFFGKTKWRLFFLLFLFRDPKSHSQGLEFNFIC